MIRRALISVSDKTGVVSFARSLAAREVEILSTGGTLRALCAEQVPAVAVEQYTGSPEVMGGRVKTLHPRVHGGILARLDQDGPDLERIGGRPIDLVVCNLYPFQRTVAGGADLSEAIENIDIGGPSMVRSAAKNHARVTVLVDPDDYPAVLGELEQGGDVSLATRQRLAAKAFAHCAAYDGAIAAYLSAESEGAAGGSFPPWLMLPFERVASLRYGENPHQRGAWYREVGAPAGTLARARQLDLGGKELSFNNLVDLDAAIAAVRDIARPAAAVIKHTNPCGMAVHEQLCEAYRLAREGDPLSAFGGIVALNRECDGATAEVIAETFVECVVAPSFSAAALERLRRKKNLRLVGVGEPPARAGLELKRISGGLVVQDADVGGAEEVRGGKVVTRRAPTERELESLEFCWQVCKHVKSNAIVLASAERPQIVGVGAGQMSRVQSVLIACDKAAERARGSVLASDAFFPFPDGIQAAAERGVTAIAQPGGSVKDAEVIAAADELGLAMVFTAVRHFRH
ncbi:MAG: bifunctional phosphoribosylaminoimidazolecarboxamide formyltransferase/IMP cyclohydrolase [Acidobacteriota bacterium]